MMSTGIISHLSNLCSVLLSLTCCHAQLLSLQKKSCQDETMVTVVYHLLVRSLAWNGSIEQDVVHYLLDLFLVHKWIAVQQLTLIFDIEIDSVDYTQSRMHMQSSEVMFVRLLLINPNTHEHYMHTLRNAFRSYRAELSKNKFAR